MRGQTCVFQTPWGWIELAASDKGVTSIVLSSLARPMRGNGQGRRRPLDEATVPSPVLAEAQTQLIEYMSGARRQFSVPLDLTSGTSFQRRVWRAILKVPFGRVRSYQWVADKIGGKQYARAVGMALGANPVPIVVPCHRIVAHDGSLGGFSCGLPLKRRLLRLEGTLEQLAS